MMVARFIATMHPTAAHQHATIAAYASESTRRFVEASEHLAELVAGRDKGAAAKLLQDALAAADQGGLKEERKGLRKRLDELGS